MECLVDHMLHRYCSIRYFGILQGAVGTQQHGAHILQLSFHTSLGYRQGALLVGMRAVLLTTQEGVFCYGWRKSATVMPIHGQVTHFYALLQQGMQCRCGKGNVA